MGPRQRDGTDGGCAAIVVDWSAEHRRVMDAQPVPVMRVLDACQLAQDDFEGIKRLATSIKLHKCSPARIFTGQSAATDFTSTVRPQTPKQWRWAR